MSERYTYRLELSAVDLDVLEDVLRNAIAERIQSPRKTPTTEDEIGALREIRRSIFVQEPPTDDAAFNRTRAPALLGIGRDGSCQPRSKRRLV